MDEGVIKAGDKSLWGPVEDAVKRLDLDAANSLSGYGSSAIADDDAFKPWVFRDRVSGLIDCWHD